MLNPRSFSREWIARQVEATAQINSYMHHLLGKSVAFVNTDGDAMEAVSDFLRDAGYDVHLNPRGETSKKFALREKTVVVRKRVLMPRRMAILPALRLYWWICCSKRNGWV